jgi:DNA modification methylase
LPNLKKRRRKRIQENSKREQTTSNHKPIKKYKLLFGDCKERLKEFPDNTFDSIVTDPPYGISFMGKKWDYDVPSVETWVECLRVLKPGGHLLSFAGTRTQHRMCVNIEDAGFEIRDMIAWVYGSGFPKSLDVSKAIDKLDATDERRKRDLKFTAWMRKTELSAKRINSITKTKMGPHYLTDKEQPTVATADLFNMLRSHIKQTVPKWVEKMVKDRTIESENFKNRKVTGINSNVNENAGWQDTGYVGGKVTKSNNNITASSTPEAKQWEGWGTALKPALEPITVARKPLGESTIAANVLKHGTGGLNIDESRVGTETITVNRHEGYNSNSLVESTKGKWKGKSEQVTGRFPANLIHDGSDEVVELFPETKSAGEYTKSMGKPETSKQLFGIDRKLKYRENNYANESGSAARFFYCAKTDKNDRDWDNDHPTVKPKALMKYLIRLVTQKGGLVLDPFMGSGSTGKAAALCRMRFVGVEMDKASMKIAKQRVKEAFNYYKV